MEEWTEQTFIQHVIQYINRRNFSTIGRQGYIQKLIQDKKHRARVLAEKQGIVKNEIDILEEMLSWEDSEFIKEEKNK